MASVTRTKCCVPKITTRVGEAERLKRCESCEGAEELICDACPVQFSKVKDPPHIKARTRNAI